MLKKTIPFTDYNGVARKEDHWFNLSKAEIMEMEMGTVGGFSEMVQKIIDTQDTPALIKLFKDLILKAYGEKSADGRQFIKSEKLSLEFSYTEAYVELYMELATNTEKAIEFINGIVPADLAEKAKEVDVAKILPGA